MRVLVVEDDVRMNMAIRRGLRAEGIVAEVAPSGLDALSMARSTDFDAVILDVMLPDIDGFETGRRLRQEGMWAPIYVRYLREKIDRPFGVRSLETVRGLGYRLRKDGGRCADCRSERG